MDRMKFALTFTTDIFLFLQCGVIYYLTTIETDALACRYEIGNIYLFTLSL